VLVIHSYYQGYKWTDDENAGIEAVLKDVVGTGNLHIEYMDTKRGSSGTFTPSVSMRCIS